MSELEARFQLEMVGIYERAKKECNYNATRLLQMVTDSGGLARPKPCSAPQMFQTASPPCGS